MRVAHRSRANGLTALTEMTVLPDLVLDRARLFRDQDTFGTLEHGTVRWDRTGTRTVPTPGPYSPLLLYSQALLSDPTLRCSKSGLKGPTERNPQRRNPTGSGAAERIPQARSLTDSSLPGLKALRNPTRYSTGTYPGTVLTKNT